MRELINTSRQRAIGWHPSVGMSVLALLAVFAVTPSLAEVRTDGSLAGLDPMLVAPGDDGVSYVDYRITPDLGELSGTNLFHSFSVFNIERGEIASFTGPDGVKVNRIISRVTGTTQSSIGGTLRSTIDGADLFLLSPAGIAVTNGAVLEVPGSIYLSTADALRFDDGQSFVVASISHPLLSAAQPSAFGFTHKVGRRRSRRAGALRPQLIAGINIGGSGEGSYSVPEGETLSFVGGDVTFTRGGERDVIKSPGSEVQIASVASPMDIPIDIRTVDPSAFEKGKFGKVIVTGANIKVDGTASSNLTAGSIVIRGESFKLDKQATLSSKHFSSNAADGVIDVAVRGAIDLFDGNLSVVSFSSGRGIDIHLSGDEVTLDGTPADRYGNGEVGSEITMVSLGSGTGGDLKIEAREVTFGPVALFQSTSWDSSNGSDLSISGRNGDSAEKVTISGSSASLVTIANDSSKGGWISIDANTLLVEDNLIEGKGGIRSKSGAKSTGGTIVLGRVDDPIEMINVADGGKIITEKIGSMDGGDTIGGDIIVFADDFRLYSDVQYATSFVLTTASGRNAAGGSIEINAQSLAILGGGQIQSDASASALRGGSINLGSEQNPITKIEVVDGGTIASGNASSGVGGDIIAYADHLWVHNTAPKTAPENDTFVFAKTTFSGDPGESDNRGAGGSIEVHASTVDLEDGGQIFTVTEGSGQGGSLSLLGVDTLRVAGEEPKREGDESAPLKSSLAARVDANGTATGGGLLINARVVEVLNGGEIASRTFGKGDAAPEGVTAIKITASERVTVQGGGNGASQISATTDFAPGDDKKAGGAAGDIEIHTALLELLDGGQVTASTMTSGEAGNVTVVADRVMVSGVDPSIESDNRSGIFAQSLTESSGQPGSIQITATDSVKLRGALIIAQSAGDKDAGNIDIDAGSFFESVSSSIETSAKLAAGGKIEVEANDLVYLFDSSFETDVFNGAEGGGDVLIDSEFTVLNRSQITARAEFGDGGNITINTDFYFESGASGLDASSNFGNDGEIQTTVPDTDLSGTLAALPSSFLDVSALLARGCEARTARAGSFVVEGTGVIEPPPDAILRATDIGLSGAFEACVQ